LKLENVVSLKGNVWAVIEEIILAGGVIREGQDCVSATTMEKGRKGKEKSP